MKINYLIQTIVFSAVFSAASTSVGFSQSLKPKEENELSARIFDFVDHITNDRETINTTIKKLEAFLLILNLDSTGTVDNIRLLAGTQFKDTLYSVFSKMTSTDFKNWRSDGCRNKTILIPVIRIARFDDFKYINEITGLGSFKPCERERLIILREIDFGWLKHIE